MIEGRNVMIKIELLAWAIKKFDEIEKGDSFHMREEIATEPQTGRKMRQITMFFKKQKGIKQEWLERETFKIWTRELKSIVGENELLKLFSTEGNEMQYSGGILKEKDKPAEYHDLEFNKYNYQFQVVIWKLY